MHVQNMGVQNIYHKSSLRVPTIKFGVPQKNIDGYQTFVGYKARLFEYRRSIAGYQQSIWGYQTTIVGHPQWLVGIIKHVGSTKEHWLGYPKTSLEYNKTTWGTKDQELNYEVRSSSISLLEFIIKLFYCFSVKTPGLGCVVEIYSFKTSQIKRNTKSNKTNTINWKIIQIEQ